MLLCARCGSRRKLPCDFWVGRVARCQRAHHFRQRNERVAAFQVGALAVELSGEPRYPPAGADVRDAAAVRAIDLHGFKREGIASVARAMAFSSRCGSRLPRRVWAYPPRFSRGCGPLERCCNRVRGRGQWRGWRRARPHRAPLGPRLTGALHRVVFMHVHNLLGAAHTVALRGIGGRRKLCGFMHLAYAHVPSHEPSGDRRPQ